MPANKRIRKSSARTTKDLVAQTKPVPMRADELKKAMHRLEVEIVAAGHAASERRHGGAFSQSSARAKGCGVQQRLTYAQARERRSRFALQAAMFLTSTCLVAGAGAWLYRFWQSVH
jgi:hypothetical protein